MRMEMRKVTIIATVLLLLGLVIPVCGEIGLYVLALEFGAIMFEICRASMPGKGVR